jgi:hypothetical protein
MTVHSFHIFDRKGKTLFTKRYVKSNDERDDLDNEQLSEQRKLVFGMIFSLRELSSSLSPGDGPGDLHLVKTGTSAWYNYETVSGLRFVLYATAETSVGAPSAGGGAGGAAGAAPSSGGTNLQGGPSVVAGAVPSNNNSGHGGGPSAAALGGEGGDGAMLGTSSNPSLTAQASSLMTSPAMTANIRAALRHIYEQIWVTFVVRSPMYQPLDPDIRSTNFEASLDSYLRGMPWFR